MAQLPNREDRRITIPRDVWLSLTYYANDERQNVSEEIRGAIGPESISIEILKNHLEKMGHYPPKCDTSKLENKQDGEEK
jgi:hypothetical protein